MKICRVYLFAMALMMGFMTPVGAQEKGANDWKYGLAVYLWGTGIEGTSQIGPVTAPVDISFSDALDNLSGAFMLHFEAQKSRWGFMADVMHINLDPEAALPSGATLTLDTTNNIVDLAATYQPATTDILQLLFGLRFTEFELEGTVPGVISQTIADESWTDAFVGGRLLVPFGNSKNWRFRARADIGAGDSDLVWNAVLGIDYKFSKRVAAMLGYRWLDYDYDNGEAGQNRFAYDVRYEGPAAALVFTW